MRIVDFIILIMKKVGVDPCVACYITGKLYNENPHELWKENFKELQKNYKTENVVIKSPFISLSVILNKLEIGAV